MKSDLFITISRICRREAHPKALRLRHVNINVESNRPNSLAPPIPRSNGPIYCLTVVCDTTEMGESLIGNKPQAFLTDHVFRLWSFWMSDLMNYRHGTDVILKVMFETY